MTTSWRAVSMGPLIGACLAALAMQPAAWAQGAPAGAPRQIVLLGALVRDARIAQRDCDIEAKRAAVNGIQMALRDVRLTLRRTMYEITRAAGQLQSAGVDLAALKRSRTALDAADAVGRAARTTRKAGLRKRLAALRDRYLDFDEWEVFYADTTSMLARLDGAPGNCAAPVVRPSVACSPDAFEACRYGAPTAGATPNQFVAVPVRKR